MVSKRMIALIGGIVVLVLVLAGSGVGARAPVQEEEGNVTRVLEEEEGNVAEVLDEEEIGERGTRAMECFDNIWCNSANWAIKVVNPGGHGIFAKTGTSTGWKAAVYGEASDQGCGVSGKSYWGDGVRGDSHWGHGGKFSSTKDDGVRVEYAGDDGVHVKYAKDAGVYVASAETYGGDFRGDTCGVAARSDSGDLIRAYDLLPQPANLRFKVTNAGNVYADGVFSPGGADFSEMLPAVEGLEPADVLVVNQDGKLARSSKAYATSVIGVYSTKPGFVGGWDDDGDMTGKVPLAVVGVVPVKASAENGAIRPGDLLATSSIPGHAMKATEPKLGTLIGKALGRLDSGTGTIQMLVTLQ